jgi:hypothetical protein
MAGDAFSYGANRASVFPRADNTTASNAAPPSAYLVRFRFLRTHKWRARADTLLPGAAGIESSAGAAPFCRRIAIAPTFRRSHRSVIRYPRIRLCADAAIGSMLPIYKPWRTPQGRSPVSDLPTNFIGLICAARATLGLMSEPERLLAVIGAADELHQFYVEVAALNSEFHRALERGEIGPTAGHA